MVAGNYCHMIDIKKNAIAKAGDPNADDPKRTSDQRGTRQKAIQL